MLGIIRPTLENTHLKYNYALNTNLFGIDLGIGMSKPIGISNTSNDWKFEVFGNFGVSQNGVSPTRLYNPNMSVVSKDDSGLQLLLNGDMPNNILWAVYNTNKAVIDISQATLDKLGVKLISLYTDQLVLMFSKILTKYGTNKGVYFQLMMQNYDPKTTKIQMKSGKINILLDTKVNMFVDTDSSHYPQASISDCTTCQKAFEMNLNLFLDLGAAFTNTKEFYLTDIGVNLNSINVKDPQFEINVDMFETELSNIAESMLKILPNLIPLKNTPLENVHSRLDIIDEKLHLQIN